VFDSVDVLPMSRDTVGRLNRILARSPRSIRGGQHVARLFVPGYDGGISINVEVRHSRNSDARRRLARMFESRRLVS
jgi:hypothetical protein